MKEKFCFCNVSFGERYVRTQTRLRESILRFHPNAELFFWTNEYPPGSKTHTESYYGFKVHAIQYARQQGFTKIIWIDTCAVLNHPIIELFPLVEKDGIFVVEDDNRLYRYIGDKFIESSGLSSYKDIPIEWHLVGGSIYIFDFTRSKALSIFQNWYMCEEKGDFGSAISLKGEYRNGEERCGHRMDESVLAYCMYTHGVEPFKCDVGRYNQNENSVILKQHFLEVGEKWYDKPNQ